MSEEKTSECLYYRAYRSFLLQSPEFNIDFQLLQKQRSDFPDSFSLLTDKDQIRLRQMQSAFYTGRFVIFEGCTYEFSNIILPDPGKSDKNHKELVNEIYKQRAVILEPYTGPIEDACIEYPVIDGFVDLMAQSNRCAYIIEVKTSTADHAIIGQTMKYYVGVSLQLVLKFFNDVKIITICPGYDPASYRGLKQIGATILSINTENMKVSAI